MSASMGPLREDGEGPTLPFSQQMAKVELEKLSEKGSE